MWNFDWLSQCRKRIKELKDRKVFHKKFYIGV